MNFNKLKLFQTSSDISELHVKISAYTRLTVDRGMGQVSEFGIWN